MRLELITFSMMVLVAGTALAGEPLVEAEKLAKDGEFASAAAIYGKELANAQKKNDLEWQERVVDSMRRSFRMRPGDGPREDDPYACTLRTLMLALDARRNAAFCSAGQLSHALLFDATRTGDYALVADAASVCMKYAKIKKVGPYAEAMADYAAGLSSMAAGECANAIPNLESALEVMSRENWAWPTIHVATELAAACLGAERDDLAAGALTKAGAVLKQSGDPGIAQQLRPLLKGRLRGASEEVTAAGDAALAPFSGGTSVGAAGGAGGAGGRGGGPEISKVGEVWNRLSAKAPFVTVTGTDDGYVVREIFDPEFKGEQPRKHGVKHHADGGITLSFWDGGVALHMIDLTGLRGQPGEASEPGLLTFFHPLARGYTWGVTKAGIVTQTKAR